MNCPYCKQDNSLTYYKAQMPNILSACSEEMVCHIKSFPLEARLCKECLLGFNASKLNQQELEFIYDNYLYVSPLHGIGTSKYEGMIQTLIKYYSKNDTIVEIGCSEGHLLHELQKAHYSNLTGIEPGPQAQDARKFGLNIIEDYFDEKTFEGKLLDGFFLMHVFEHFDDPFSVLKAMKNQLSKSGKIIIEVPNFGGYHHQHLFYYNAPFIMRMCQENDLKVVEQIIEKGALRVVIVHKGNDSFQEIEETVPSESIIQEAETISNDFQKKVDDLNEHIKNNGVSKIYWWGAGSASVIFLNQIDPQLLKRSDIIIVDGDEKKWGKIIPGINKSVHPYTILNNSDLNNLIIASSFASEIQDTMNKHHISSKNITIIQ